MAKPKIAVFSGPTATVSWSPPLVTSNKGRLPGERTLPGPFDPLVPQLLYEPVIVKIKKFSAHPLEEDSKEAYHDDGREYYEVTLRPEDGLYLLPYVARKADGSPQGAPFEPEDQRNPAFSRQPFYPDASRLFAEIDRSLNGRDLNGYGNVLSSRADYDFVRVLPPGGYRKKGELPGVDYFPIGRSTRVKDLARAVNVVWNTLKKSGYAGAIWLEGTPSVEETLYWFSLLIDTDIPIVGTSSQQPHGQLGNNGDRNIIASVEYIVSGLGRGLGGVVIQDEQIFAAREVKKGDARPGGYKATGGHGGILGTTSMQVTIWYRPGYKHTSSSEVNLSRLPGRVEFLDRVGDGRPASLSVKNSDGTLREEAIPRVYLVKMGSYAQEDETDNPDDEADIMARIARGLEEQSSADENKPKLHGFVLEGRSPYGTGGGGQMAALEIAAMSGMPVVKVGRSDPGGRTATNPNDLTIEGSNLDATKARLLLIAAMLKLGRLPKAKDPRRPSRVEREAVIARIADFQAIFENH
jgi:L-asparaginase/Glu-tRNA(Gln) amidotransferase subunit D